MYELIPLFLLSDYYDDDRFFTSQDGLWKVSAVQFKMDKSLKLPWNDYDLEYGNFSHCPLFKCVTVSASMVKLLFTTTQMNSSVDNFVKLFYIQLFVKLCIFLKMWYFFWLISAGHTITLDFGSD